MLPSGPFLGAEALADGTLTRHQLRTRFVAIFPGVYLDKTVEQTLDARITAAWLWSGRTAVVGGIAASAVLGAKWVPSDATIELISGNTRPPRGIRCRNDRLLDDEVRRVRGIALTTVERTIFDLARRGPVDTAVARADALLNATGAKVADVALLAERHPHTRGLRQAETVLALVDAGAESPRETRLRLLLIRNGLPAPETQIEVHDEHGRFVARLDMGWPDLMIAVEYDGEQHRIERRQYIRDVRRLEVLQRLGWIVIRIVKEDSAVDILRRVRAARLRRCG